MYFDDAHITDWKCAGASQCAFTEMNIILGTPSAADKKQHFSSQGTFLGLDFDFSTINTLGWVTFWAREKLLTKTQQIIVDAKETHCLSPAQASKLYGYGPLNFLENGMFGRVGC